MSRENRRSRHRHLRNSRETWPNLGRERAFRSLTALIVVKESLPRNRPIQKAAPERLRTPPGYQRQVVEQGWPVRLCAFDRQQTQLADYAARGREAACLAPGRQHAMARHDDGTRILSERGADLAREQFVA